MKVHCKYTKLAPIDEVRPNPENSNTHTGEQLERLAKILQVQGWRRAIVVSKRSGLVVSGHGRLLASRMAGFDKVPIDEQDYESEEQEMADMVADNKIAELAEWNSIRLNDQLANLNSKIDDIELSGFSDVDLSELAESLYAPELSPASATGEITGEQINAVGDRLTGQFDGAPQSQNLIKITCPHCGDDFSINATEIDR
jgi:hypothetical protein